MTLRAMLSDLGISHSAFNKRIGKDAKYLRDLMKAEEAGVPIDAHPIWLTLEQLVDERIATHLYVRRHLQLRTQFTRKKRVYQRIWGG